MNKRQRKKGEKKKKKRNRLCALVWLTSGEIERQYAPIPPIDDVLRLMFRTAGGPRL